MDHRKRYAVYALSGGLVLAVGTPFYVDYAVCGGKLGYVHYLGSTLFRQSMPYLLCAGLWLPWRARETTTVGIVLSWLLFTITIVLYLPELQAKGCDFREIFFGAISIWMSFAVLVCSGIALLVLGLRARVKRQRASRKVAA